MVTDTSMDFWLTYVFRLHILFGIFFLIDNAIVAGYHVMVGNTSIFDSQHNFIESAITIKNNLIQGMY